MRAMFVRDLIAPAGRLASNSPPVPVRRGFLTALAWAFPAVFLISCSDVPNAALSFCEFSPGVALATQRVDKLPWTILVVRVDRSRPDLAFESVHAHGTSVGLSTLTEQIGSLDPVHGRALAGLNADFYQMWGRPYPGRARNLQVVDGELLGVAPEGVCFWVDGAGRPHAERVSSRFRVTWPNGYTNIFGLNEAVQTNSMVLFTPSLGMSSTGTTNACELVLEREDGGPWLPVALGKKIAARVRELRPAGNTPLTPEIMVLAVDMRLAWKVPGLEPGAVLRFSFDVSPDLTGINMAIGGGPILVRDGKWQGLKQPGGFGTLRYEYKSMVERHPRSALGWNDAYYYLVQVDGRQKTNSVGMTLKELGTYMAAIGCRQVINFDGGGSSELWCNGRVVNQPCDRQERDMANSLVLVRKRSGPASANHSGLSSSK